jgi:cysteine desulfurase
VIYLDNNATTQPSEGVVRAVVAALTEYWHNPSSIHRPGQNARAQVELARASVAALIGARPREVVFTSGGTEAIDLCIRGVVEREPGKPIVTTCVEHSAVRELVELLAGSGTPVRYLALDGEGVVDIARAGETLSGAGLLTIQWANNETGAIQPVKELASIARREGALIHIDATQWVGKMPADVSTRWCDLLTFSPHKFHGPKGVGTLWIHPGVGLRPRILGVQELGRRGGTENVPGIVGAGVSAREASEWLADPSARERLGALRDLLERLVLEGYPAAVVNGPRTRRIWNTTNIGFPRLEAEALLMLLSERGVCASAGAACSSGSLEPSPVLLAMGIPPEIAHGSLRFSLSRHTTEDEVREAAGIIVECATRLARSL